MSGVGLIRPELAEESESHPFVSVVIPVRNEEAFIRRTLGALLDQDYPSQCYELIVVDGESEDATAAIVEEFAATAPVRTTLISNPKRIVPVSMNLGIRAASGEIVARMDGHVVPEADYLSGCVDTLLAGKGTNVGGVVHFSGSSEFALTAGACAQSVFGAGGAPARSGKEGPVDSVSFGCWRKESLIRLGGFDERFVRTQDAELNFRIRRMGGVVWMSPRIRSTYYSRTSLRGLVRQYVQYGFWKTRLYFKHGGGLAARHAGPPMLTMLLAVASLSSLVGLWAGNGVLVLAGALPWLTYGSMSVLASVVLAIALRRPSVAVMGWVIFPALHLSWGTGFILGILTWPSQRATWRVEI